MKLHDPFKISARLLPALQIGGAWIQLQYHGLTGDKRTRYKWTIDLPQGEFSGRDLSSGVGGGSLQTGFQSLLCFLSAAGEAYAYKMRTGRAVENDDLFPKEVVEWAYQNSDELSMLCLEIDEMPNLIEE